MQVCPLLLYDACIHKKNSTFKLFNTPIFVTHITWLRSNHTIKYYLHAIENLCKHPEGSNTPDKHNIGCGMTQEWNQNILSKESVKMAISFLSWTKKKKKTILAPLPLQSPEHFPTALMSIFQVLCQQNTSSAAPLRIAYSWVLLPDSPLYWGIRSKIVQTQLHNRDRGLMQLTPFQLWPKCNSFHGPELECHSTQPSMQGKINYKIIKLAHLIGSLTF